MTIIEKRSTIVPKSIDWSASGGPTTPSATMSTAPITAAPGRSIFMPGNLPSAKTTWLATKIAYAATDRTSDVAADADQKTPAPPTEIPTDGHQAGCAFSAVRSGQRWTVVASTRG